LADQFHAAARRGAVPRWADRVEHRSVATVSWPLRTPLNKPLRNGFV